MSKGTWNLVTLREIATDIKDGTHGTHSRIDEGVPLLSAKNISADGKVVLTETEELISECEYNLITAGFSPRPGDLLITIVGSVGRRALFDGSKVAFQRSVAFVRPTKDVLSDYLFHATGASEFTLQLIQRSNATAQAGLYLGELAKVRIPLPPLPTQRRIAEILSTLDETIEQTEALIAKYQQIKAGLMHDLFTRGVMPNGKLRPQRAEAPQLYKESPLGWIPKEWEVIPLISFAASRPGSFVNGPFGSDLLTSELTDSGVRVIYVQDIKEDDYHRVSNAHVTEDKANKLAVCNVRFGDVLVAKVGDPPGLAAAYLEIQRAVVTQDVIRIRPADDVVTQFLASLLNSTVGHRAIRKITIEGTRARVSLTEFKCLPLPKPMRKEQQLIAERISVIQRGLGAFSNELEKLKLQKHGLMHDLLTGRVHVKADD